MEGGHGGPGFGPNDIRMANFIRFLAEFSNFHGFNFVLTSACQGLRLSDFPNKPQSNSGLEWGGSPVEANIIQAIELPLSRYDTDRLTVLMTIYGTAESFEAETTCRLINIILWAHFHATS